jgi:hypothetical protein
LAFLGAAEIAHAQQWPAYANYGNYQGYPAAYQAPQAYGYYYPQGPVMPRPSYNAPGYYYPTPAPNGYYARGAVAAAPAGGMTPPSQPAAPPAGAAPLPQAPATGAVGTPAPAPKGTPAPAPAASVPGGAPAAVPAHPAGADGPVGADSHDAYLGHGEGAGHGQRSCDELLWVNADYDLAWIRPGRILGGPLVTTGNPLDPLGGVLGQPGTAVLFGNDLRFRAFSGFQLNAGVFLDDADHVSLEVGGFVLPTNTVRFGVASDAAATPSLSGPS